MWQGIRAVCEMMSVWSTFDIWEHFTVPHAVDAENNGAIDEALELQEAAIQDTTDYTRKWELSLASCDIQIRAKRYDDAMRGLMILVPCFLSATGPEAKAGIFNVSIRMVDCDLFREKITNREHRKQRWEVAKRDLGPKSNATVIESLQYMTHLMQEGNYAMAFVHGHETIEEDRVSNEELAIYKVMLYVINAAQLCNLHAANAKNYKIIAIKHLDRLKKARNVSQHTFHYIQTQLTELKKMIM